MKLFKNIKRKVGNALIPVIGTILALTILAGSVVAIALNSSRIVYRKKRLQNQNDARQIIYLAAKYFSTEMNNGKNPSDIKDELQEIFGPGLKVTQDYDKEDKFYIWYPNVFVDGSQTEYDPTKGDSQVKEWLKATVEKTEMNDDDGDHGEHGINNALFSKEAKLDEKFAIGNMMTVYLTDEHLLPGRQYSINEVSLVESDIDTFDEAFTYMNNTGVLEIDDIVVALYKYRAISENQVSYIETPESESQPYTIVYKTGNLGGNYYWQNTGTDYETWLYRQEYDIDMLYKLMQYNYPNSFNVNKTNLKYAYDETVDSHRIYSNKSSDNFEVEYSSSQKFAEAIADYVFWEGLPRLCMLIDDFKTKLYDLVEARLLEDNYDCTDGYGYTAAELASYYYSYRKTRNDYEWTNKGLKAYIYWKDYRNYYENSNWYKTYEYMQSDIESIFVQYFSSFTSGGKVDRQKIYNYLMEHCAKTVKSEYLNGTVYNDMVNYYKSNNNNMLKLQGDNTESYTSPKAYTPKMYSKFEVEYQNYGNNSKEKMKNQTMGSSGTWNKYSDWEKGYKNGTYNDYNYFYDNSRFYNPNFYKKSEEKSFDYELSVGTNKLTSQIIDYINGVFTEKYIINQATLTSTNSQGVSFDQFASNDTEKLICKPHWIHQNNGKWEIRFQFAIIGKKAGATDNHNKYKSYEYERKVWDSMYTGDTIYMTDDEFFENFAEGICEVYINATHMNQSQYDEFVEQNEYVEENIVTLTREYLMKQMVDPLRYQYLPTSNMNSIIGYNSTKPGMKEGSIANKLLTYYLEHGEEDLKRSIGNYDYQINILDFQYKDDLPSDSSDFINCEISFEIVVNDGSNTVTIPRTVSFILQYMTYSAQNNALYNSENDTYTDVLNGNYTTEINDNNETKHIFYPVVIKNSNGSAINVSDIEAGNIGAILSNIPYTERIKSNQVKYGDHKITIDGKTYNVVDQLTFTYKNNAYVAEINENTLVSTSINSLKQGSTYGNGNSYVTADMGQIKVKDGVSLFINGDLQLQDNNQVVLGDNSLLFVNGNLNVKYEYYKTMSFQGNTYYVQQMSSNDRSWFRNRGVNIYAGADAKIMINGNFDYKGYKAKYAQSNSGFYIHHADGSIDQTRIDTIFEQYVFSTGFKSNNNCQKGEDGFYDHFTEEARGVLQGVYIINGDMVFHAWDELNTTNNSYSQEVAMYRNMYSNPIINGTFYVDGTFDMRGLYTSGLYDKCRANFVFAKSIIEPAIALNTILCAGANSNYEAWKNTDGYLFMICEEAIDFSKVNFACINLFTPFQELVNAINANKVSETNFSKFINKDEFTDMFPNNSVIDEWGLPSILRSGLKQLYDPGDIGAITPEDEIYGNPV